MLCLTPHRFSGETFMCEDVDECNSIAKTHNCSTYADCSNSGQEIIFINHFRTQFVNSFQKKVLGSVTVELVLPALVKLVKMLTSVQ